MDVLIWGQKENGGGCGFHPHCRGRWLAFEGGGKNGSGPFVKVQKKIDVAFDNRYKSEPNAAVAHSAPRKVFLVDDAPHFNRFF
ncbi:MAG: hypothetical protein P8130_01105 [Deltaproteobacteria bacterium]